MTATVCIPATGALCNSGDVAWVITATALVMIMTPGLGFFYGGLVRRKNLVSTIVQCMAIFAVVSLAWAIWGYTLAFGPSTLGGFIGNFQYFGLNGVGTAADTTYSSTIPALLYFAFQLKFAAITPALIIGAFAGRIRFKALLIFILAWVTFIYFPVADWIWGGGGWLHVMGVEDFAGGMVVHTTAGVSALAAALVIGRGVDFGKGSRPNNVPYVILGTAILWFGWFGFNAGQFLVGGRGGGQRVGDHEPCRRRSRGELDAGRLGSEGETLRGGHVRWVCLRAGRGDPRRGLRKPFVRDADWGRGGRRLQLRGNLEGPDQAGRFVGRVRLPWGRRNLGNGRDGTVRFGRHQRRRPEWPGLREPPLRSASDVRHRGRGRVRLRRNCT